MKSRFDPAKEDKNISSIHEAVNFADKMIKFAAYLRNVDPAKINIEIDRFFKDGYIGPIMLTGRKMSPRLQQIWQFNSHVLHEMLGKKF